MGPDSITIVVAATGFLIGWGVFVTVSIFNQREAIALLKQEVNLLRQILVNQKTLKERE